MPLGGSLSLRSMLSVMWIKRLIPALDLIHRDSQSLEEEEEGEDGEDMEGECRVAS